MLITRKDVAEKLSAYLRHQTTLSELVDWAEQAMLDGDFDEVDFEKIRDVVSRLGVADIREFGPTWEDFEKMLRILGYTVRLEIEAA